MRGGRVCTGKCTSPNKNILGVFSVSYMENLLNICAKDALNTGAEGEVRQASPKQIL